MHLYKKLDEVMMSLNVDFNFFFLVLPKEIKIVHQEC